MSGKTKAVLGVALAVLAVGAVWMLVAGKSSPGGGSLLLYCGAGLRPAASEIINSFEERTGVRVHASYQGSGMQLGQISSSQRGDLFMPGAEFYVDRAVEMGLADPLTKRIVAYFVPVIFVRKGNPRGIRSVRDLTREGTRVGLGDERACAVGGKALEILEKNGVSLADMEKNVVYKSGTVNELGVAVELGTVDAAIVWDATARNFAASGTTVAIPLERNSISTVPIVVLRSSARPGLAGRFVEFLTSEAGREILVKNGYTVELTRAGAGAGQERSCE